MKRILHIIPSLTSGGAERQLANIISNTTAGEFSHYVCTFKDSEFFASEIREAGHTVNQLDAFGKHPWYSGTRKILAVIRDYKPDLITSWLFDANIVGRLIHFIKPGIPLICTLHSTDYEPETIQVSGWSPVKIEGLRLIDKLTVKMADPLFSACSKTVKSSYLKQIGIADSKIKVIYNGVDPASLDCDDGQTPQNLRGEFEIPADGFVYISVGRLVASKNISLLMQAFAKVSDAVPQAYLAIVGDGDLEDELKESASALNIDHRVRFFGTRRDIGACLKMADVFVMPSFFEGHPLALIEAMFKKLPSVSSNIEVLQEIITDGENGLLFNLDNPDALSEAMIKLFRRKDLREQLGRQAFEDANRRFHIKWITAEWEDFFNSVMTPKNLPGKKLVLENSNIDTGRVEK